MRRTSRLGRRGFSLIEISVVLAILLVVLAAIYMTMATGRVSWQTTEASVQVQEDVRKGLRSIGQELRESGRIDSTAHVIVDADGDSIVFQIPLDADSATDEFDLDAGEIVWGAIDNDGNLQEGYAILYALDGEQLTRQIVDALALDGTAVGAPRVVANHIASVTFTQLPDDGSDIEAVDIELRAETTSLAQHDAVSEQRDRIVLRNVFEE